MLNSAYRSTYACPIEREGLLISIGMASSSRHYIVPRKKGSTQFAYMHVHHPTAFIPQHPEHTYVAVCLYECMHAHVYTSVQIYAGTRSPFKHDGCTIRVVSHMHICTYVYCTAMNERACVCRVRTFSLVVVLSSRRLQKLRCVNACMYVCSCMHA